MSETHPKAPAHPETHEHGDKPQVKADHGTWMTLRNAVGAAVTAVLLSSGVYKMAQPEHDPYQENSRMAAELKNGAGHGTPSSRLNTKPSLSRSAQWKVVGAKTAVDDAAAAPVRAVENNGNSLKGLGLIVLGGIAALGIKKREEDKGHDSHH